MHKHSANGQSSFGGPGRVSCLLLFPVFCGGFFLAVMLFPLKCLQELTCPLAIVQPCPQGNPGKKKLILLKWFFFGQATLIEVLLTWDFVSVLGSSIDLVDLNLSQWSSINTQLEQRLGSPLILSVADTSRVCNLQARVLLTWGRFKSLQPCCMSCLWALLRFRLGAERRVPRLHSQLAGGCGYVSSDKTWHVPVSSCSSIRTWGLAKISLWSHTELFGCTFRREHQGLPKSLSFFHFSGKRERQGRCR